MLSPILIYRLSTVYVPCINRISTVADSGRIAFSFSKHRSDQTPMHEVLLFAHNIIAMGIIL